MFSAPDAILQLLRVTPRRSKCTRFRQNILYLNLGFTQLLQHDFSKQQYITLNATSSGQDRIYPKTQVCRTFLLSIFDSARINPQLKGGRNIRIGNSYRYIDWGRGLSYNMSFDFIYSCFRIIFYIYNIDFAIIIYIHVHVP